MTNSERKAQRILRIFFPDAYIKKIPDFKTTGNKLGGLPDYLMIKDGNTIWFEIKSISKKFKSLNFNHFTHLQWKEFTKMHSVGAKINIFILKDKYIYCIPWQDILKIYRQGKKSMGLDILNNYFMKISDYDKYLLEPVNKKMEEEKNGIIEG